LRIAIVGTRGVPASYGGFETLAWELSVRLADRGHEVTVYCRPGRTDEAVQVPDGVRRVFLPSLPGKYLETVSHTGLSVIHSLLRGYDAMWVGNAANAVFTGVPRLRGTVVVLNVDGIERQRKKWGRVGRAWYSVGERLALTYPNAIVADADVIRDYYRLRYRKPSRVITYGATVLPRTPAPDLSRHGLPAGVQPGRYFLYVSRLEPENQADMVIRAYRSVGGTIPLLIVGDAPYAERFKATIRDLARQDSRVLLTGAIYGAGYRDLQRGALAYIQATSVGGTHPALVEAMAAGNAVLAFGTPENREVVGDTGLFFDDEAQLTALFERLADPAESDLIASMREAALARATSTYSWEAVTDQYLDLWRRLGARG
jgi:glycosyltransferase involved in cell wall biosynthesis